MVVFSPIVLLLCTLWELRARFFNIYSAFTDKKKKKCKNTFEVVFSFIRIFFLASTGFVV